MTDPRYTVHVSGNGSTGFARAMAHVSALSAARAMLADFAKGTGAHGDSFSPGAWADVYPYSPDDTVDMTYGDYPLLRYITGPRGGVQLTLC